MIMEEEAKCLYGTNFSFAERDFFINKLLKVTPNMSQEAINQSIAFLERKKEANCPCTIHTQKREYDWIVFNRLPDRIPSNQNDGNQMSDSGDSTGFSDRESNAENEVAKVSDTISSHENMEEVNNQKNQDASGALIENFTSTDLTTGYNAIFNPSVSNSSNELSQNSRDERHIRYKKNVTKQNRTKKRKKRPTKTEKLEDIPEDMLEENNQGIDSSIPCKFDQIVYMDNVKGKTYSFRYFKVYKYDWRLLINHPNGEPMTCKCPRGRLHNQQCPWYHSEVINVPDIENTLSTSEQAVQGKIYDMYYQNTQNGQESCGCGTAAEIAYMGHKSTCVEFQWINERSSYEMLLAVLKKRKKVTLFENFQQQHKRPRLQSTSSFGTNEDITKDSKTDVNMDNLSTLTTATNSLAVLAEVAHSHSSQSSLPDLIGEQNGGADCPCEDDEEMPPLEDADSTELSVIKKTEHSKD